MNTATDASSAVSARLDRQHDDLLAYHPAGDGRSKSGDLPAGLVTDRGWRFDPSVHVPEENMEIRAADPGVGDVDQDVVGS